MKRKHILFTIGLVTMCTIRATNIKTGAFCPYLGNKRGF